MKRGKKISEKLVRRSLHHDAAIEARRKKGIVVDLKAFKAPGSRNLKKT